MRKNNNSMDLKRKSKNTMKTKIRWRDEIEEKVGIIWMRLAQDCNM